MSRADADFAGAVGGIFRFFGDSASYTARGAAAVPVVAVVEHNLAQFGEVATVAARTVAISVRRSELADPPRAGDAFLMLSGPFSGRTFRVADVIASDDLEHRVTAA